MTARTFSRGGRAVIGVVLMGSVARRTRLSNRNTPHWGEPFVDCRASWWRPHWNPDTTHHKYRIFRDRRAALRFIERLRERGPLSWVRLEVRTGHVSPWTEVES